MIGFKQKGDFSKTIKYLKKQQQNPIDEVLRRYADNGVRALSNATPVDTGKTAKSWDYKITKTKDTIKLAFINSNVNKGVQIAIILQYGHATKNGGWVQGRDYINPAIQPIFDEIAEKAWKEVCDA